MLEARGDRDLTRESVAQDRTGLDELLDRDLTTEPRIVRLRDPPKTTACELSRDDVARVLVERSDRKSVV